MLPNDVNAQLSLLRSLLSDLDRHMHPRKLAAENVEICQRLLESEDAQRMLSPEFLRTLQGRVNDLSEKIVKRAQEEVQYVRKRIGRR